MFANLLRPRWNITASRQHGSTPWATKPRVASCAAVCPLVSFGEKRMEKFFHPDEAVTAAIRSVFERFAEFGSARRVWLWLRSEAPLFPLQDGPHGQIRWVVPTYTAIHHILTNPVYAGAYAYGKSRSERYIDEQGAVKKRMRHLSMDEWSVLIPEHHPGFIDWATF